jgi:hypothetical protein
MMGGRQLENNGPLVFFWQKQLVNPLYNISISFLISVDLSFIVSQKQKSHLSRAIYASPRFLLLGTFH